jgi:hypothetical protein
MAQKSATGTCGVLPPYIHTFCQPLARTGIDLLHNKVETSPA